VRVKITDELAVAPPEPRVGDALGSLGFGFDAADEAAIAEFMGERTDVSFLLPAMNDAITKHFGAAERSIEIVREPDSPSAHRTLYIFVDAFGSDDEGLHAMDQFDAEWWFDHAVPSVCVTIGRR